MKNKVALTLLCLLIFTLVGCQSKNPASNVSPTVEPTQPTPTEEDSSGVEVDQGLLNVTITLPSSFFEDSEDFDPETYKTDNDFKDVTVNEDGTVTIVMSKSRHNEIMAEMKAGVDELLEKMVEAKDTPYIKSISSTEGYRTVTVEVDREAYENAFDMTPFLVSLSTMVYQQFDGVELHCEVIIKDVETGEVLLSEIYPDAFEH